MVLGLFMELKTLLAVDLSQVPVHEDVSWRNIKTKLDYLLDTRNVSYLNKVNLAWQEFTASCETERSQLLENILAYLRAEEELRQKVSEILSLYRNKYVTPDDMAEFLQVQDNFSKLLGCEEEHLDNILLYLEWLQNALLLIRKHVINKIQDEEKRKSANAEADALLSHIKEYEAIVCANILARLEVIAKYGFVDSLGLMAIAGNQINNNITTWNEIRFQNYYLFVLSNGTLKQQKQLQDLTFDFGTLYVAKDKHIAACPNIYAEGELLMVKPWFGYLRPGARARYNLFSKGFLLVDLNAKVKLAQKPLADFKPESLMRAKERLIAGFNAIANEKTRVTKIQQSLWSYLCSKEYELCTRWQNHLQGLYTNIYDVQLLQLQELTADDDSMLSLMLNKDSMICFGDILKLLKGSEYYDNVFRFILRAILQVLLRNNLEAKKYMQALAYLFADENLAKLIIGDRYYSDAWLLFSSLTSLDKDEALFEVVKKYSKETGDLIECFLPSKSEFSSTIIMQAYLNKKLMRGELISDECICRLNKLYDDQPMLVNSYIKDFEVAGSYHDVEAAIAVSYQNVDDFLAKLSAVSGHIVLSYRLCSLISNKLSKQPLHGCEYRCLPVVLEYGDLATKHKYVMGVFRAKLQASMNLEAALMAADYYNIMVYDKELGDRIRYDIQQEMIAMLVTSYSNSSLAEVEYFFRGTDSKSSILQDFTLEQQESINAFIAMKFASCWSAAACYVISLFASDLVKSQYYLKLIRKLALESSYNDSLQESLTYLKTLNEADSYYWRRFGMQNDSVCMLTSHVSFAVMNAKNGDDRVEFLDFIFSNKILVKFYKLEELQLSWEARKPLLAASQKSLVRRTINHNISFDELVETVGFLEQDSSELVAEVISVLHVKFKALIEESLFTGDLSEMEKYYDEIISKLICLEGLTVQQQYELKFLAWLATKTEDILNSSLIFWQIAEGLRDINVLSLYLYHINYYAKQNLDKLQEKFQPYKSYISSEGVLRFFCENKEEPNDVCLEDAMVDDNPPLQLNMQAEMVLELQSIDGINISAQELENAIDSLNYLIEFAVDEDIRRDAKEILSKLLPEACSSGYSPGFFSSQVGV